MHDYRNELILYTKKLYAKASRFGINTKYVYRRIVNELENLNTPIYSIDDIKIKGVGIKTKELFIKDVFNVNNEIDKDKLKLDTNNEILNKNKIEPIFSDKNDTLKNTIRLSLSSINLTPIKTKKQKLIKIDLDKKLYIPKYKSGSYAILKTLWRENGLSKHIICNKANKFSTHEFDLTQKFSAWNGIKTLFDKNLVYKEDKKFFLTEKGCLVCKKLDFKYENDICETEEVKLIIDAREMKSKKDRTFFQRQINDSETRNLIIGDFLWLKGEKVLNFIVERKKGSDFVSSISDGRFNEQKKRLKETGIGNIFYIVENLKEKDIKKIGENYAKSCLLSTKSENFIVLETNSINETADVLKIIDIFVREDVKLRDLDDFDNLQNKFFLGDNNYEDDSNFKYDNFNEKGKKNYNLTSSEILYKALLAIKGISHEKAVFLANKYSSFENFLGDLKNENFVEDFGSMCINDKKIGKKISQKIFDLFS
ncbi:Crossover junction endonuclease mus81 [Gurleya vavrai]